MEPVSVDMIFSPFVAFRKHLVYLHPGKSAMLDPASVSCCIPRLNWSITKYSGKKFPESRETLDRNTDKKSYKNTFYSHKEEMAYTLIGSTDKRTPK
jgi:hypothetical protein